MHNATYVHAFSTKSKVGELHVALAVQEDVLWFEVSAGERDQLVTSVSSYQTMQIDRSNIALLIWVS